MRAHPRRAGALAFGLGLGALALALWRRDIPFETLEARYGDRSRYILTPQGVRLHYRDVGRAEGPPLVLLHGYAASTLEWTPWVERLEARHRLIVIDFPGHGLTAAPPGSAPDLSALVSTVVALLDALAVPRAVIVGNSMGGQVAWRFALDHPGRTAALVLVCATGWSDNRRGGSPPSPVFRLIASRLGRFVLRHADLTPLVRRGLRTALGEARLVTPALVRRTTDLSRAPGHRRILTGLQVRGGDPADLSRLGTIRAPTLVMAGEDDQLVPSADAGRFAGAIPGADLILYPGVGHVPMQQAPDRSAADLAAWLEARLPGA